MCLAIARMREAISIDRAIAGCARPFRSALRSPDANRSTRQPAGRAICRPALAAARPELTTLITALGTGVGDAKDLEKLRYRKIILPSM